jgi:hypothetical protein
MHIFSILLSAAAAVASGFSLSSAQNDLARVLLSRGPTSAQLPAGRMIRPVARIKLQRGDSVLLLHKGGTRLFRGPGAFRVIDPPRPSARQTHAAFARSRSQLGVSRVGADAVEQMMAREAAAEAELCKQVEAELAKVQPRPTAPPECSLSPSAT